MKMLSGRRQFLKGAAVVGAGLYTIPIAAMSRKIPELQLVFSEKAYNPAFVRGVTGNAKVNAGLFAPFQPGTWHQFMEKHAGQTLIGFMDDASYQVFHAVLSSRGAKFLVTGYHAQGHEFHTTPATAGISAVLNRQISASGQAVNLREICHGAVVPGDSTAFSILPRTSSDWAELTGMSYARIARGEWIAGQPGHYGNDSQTAAARYQAAVSFVVTV